MSSANITALFGIIGVFFEGLLGLINVLLIPTNWAQPGAVQLLIWFGLVFLFVPTVFSFIIRMVRSGGGG